MKFRWAHLARVCILGECRKNYHFNLSYHSFLLLRRLSPLKVYYDLVRNYLSGYCYTVSLIRYFLSGIPYTIMRAAGSDSHQSRVQIVPSATYYGVCCRDAVWHTVYGPLLSWKIPPFRARPYNHWLGPCWWSEPWLGWINCYCYLSIMIES